MSVYKYFQKRFVLSEKGARAFTGGIFASLLLNLALMLPVMFIFLFLTDYLQPVIRSGNSPVNGFWYYVLMAAAFMIIVFVIAMFQYKNTYTNVYVESANRRIAIAEKLRRLPLAFFDEKNLSDLTATVMEDNNMIEMLFSHAVPQLFASVGSILLIAVGLFFYNWQLSLALFWVVPAAAAVIVYAKRCYRTNTGGLGMRAGDKGVQWRGQIQRTAGQISRHLRKEFTIRGISRGETHGQFLFHPEARPADGNSRRGLSARRGQHNDVYLSDFPDGGGKCL